MLFTEGKDRSLAVLKIVMALFIVVAPTLFGILNMELSACMLFLLTGLLFLLRIRNTGKGYVSICQFAMMTLLFYSAMSSFWASNKNGHYIYILIISGLIMFFGIITEYFSENSDEKAERRMMYMISLSGAVCGLWNFVYWVAVLLPFGKTESFSQGLGSSSFLAVFMLLSIVITSKLFCGNTRSRKILFVISLFLMAFTFVMTESSGWFLLAIFIVMFVATRKTKKFFVPMTLAFSVLFLIFTIISGSASEQGAVFKDVFRYGVKNLFGNGGGFWSAREIFFTSEYKDASIPGLFAVLCASSGLVGIICSLAVFGRVVFQFIKLKSWVSAANVFVTIMVMLFPLAQSPVALFLWVGLIAYNEKDAELAVLRNFNKDTVKFATWIISVISVFTAVLMCLNFVKMNALKKYNSNNYPASYELYNTVAKINPADAESCRMAAKSIYMSENITDRYAEAVFLTEKAQKWDKYNVENMLIKANVYYKCGMYELSAQGFEKIASGVVVNDRYNLETVKSLYEIICTKEKGSAEAKALYEKMTGIAERTHNLDYKEKINNIVDKALVYTKGELAVEK